jgi:hypothetical protein
LDGREAIRVMRSDCLSLLGELAYVRIDVSEREDGDLPVATVLQVV